MVTQYNNEMLLYSVISLTEEPYKYDQSVSYKQSLF